MEKLPRIAIIYLSYHSEPYWDFVLQALQKISYPKNRVVFIIVDNPHPEHGSSKKYIEENILPLSNNKLPEIIFLPQEINTGFAKGNNIGIKKALELGCSYVYLHNQDGFMKEDCLEKLVEAMEQDKTIGVAQSLVMLYPETNLINTAGNVYHFLGLGYAGRFRGEVWPSNVQEVGYASGASFIMRADLLQQYGTLDEDLISYHEDLEYSFRLKLLGYKTAAVNEAVFYHQYSFSRNKDKYYLMERNRFAVLLLYYQWLTLLFIFPVLIIWEIGVSLFAYKKGWWQQKKEAYQYWLVSKNRALWLHKRADLQKKRTVTDRQLLKNAVGRVVFEHDDVDHWVLRYVANPLMTAYWWLVKKLIVW